MQIHNFDQLESQFDFNAVRVNGESIWPVLRIYYFFKLRDLKVANHVSDNQVFFKRVAQRLKSFLRGFGQFLIKLLVFRDGYLCFSDSFELRLIEQKVQNKLFFSLFKKLGENQFLYFEKPVDSKYFKGSPSEPSSISTSFLDLMAVIGSYFQKSPAIENEHILIAAERDLGFNINYKKLVKVLMAYRAITGYLFKLLRPKAVFVSDYYNLFHLSVCHSANKLKIPVVEFQHGIINAEHAAYHFYTKPQSSDYLPKYFSSFGQKFIDCLGDHSYISRDRMIVGGHSYLSYLKTNGANKTIPSRYQTRLKKILVTLQWTDEKQVIEFIIHIAEKKEFSKTQFILLPRQWNAKIHSVFHLPENVKFEVDFDFYTMMSFVDIHVTTYSTTALEASFFGLPNILLNFEQMAKKYFSVFIEESLFDQYVNDENEFIKAFTALEHVEIKNSENSLRRKVIEFESLDSVLDLIKRHNSK